MTFNENMKKENETFISQKKIELFKGHLASINVALANNTAHPITG